MKELGEYKTLFKQGNKLKWACKYDKCIICGLCKNKHKGRGLCTRCWDKERLNTPKRKETRYKANKKYFLKKKKTIMQNELIQKLIEKTETRVKEGLPCLEIVIDGKNYKMPFETLVKPKNTSPDLKQWQKNMKIFKILKDYYLKLK